DHRADQAEPAFAQRRAEMRLTDDRRRCAGPVRVVELEPEGDIERETHRNPKPQAEKQRRPGRLQSVRQPAKVEYLAPSSRRSAGRLPCSRHREYRIATSHPAPEVLRRVRLTGSGARSNIARPRLSQWPRRSM